MKISDHPKLLKLTYKIGWGKRTLFGEKPYVMFFTGDDGEHLKFHANTTYLQNNSDHLMNLSGEKKSWTLPTDLGDLEFDEFHLTLKNQGQVCFDKQGNITSSESDKYIERAKEVIDKYYK